MDKSDGCCQTDTRLSPSRKVIHETAARKDVAPTDLPPLHRVIDPDALDALFDPTVNAARMDGTTTFEYAGYDVTVHADGYVEVTLEE
ncbi:HalOD1 output domain-containing protein [Halorientalis brevis]|uniref:HalOD1 output domain-containing protein n=1 Tax=Halorientalis brevis TaxID=1126241 RepID=A0ABD6CGG0_9EURY|nr:HalOD1 output domain-containing protein [Halorientalis brevis]